MSLAQPVIIENAKITPSDSSEADFFAQSVSIYGDLMVASCARGPSGSVYVFRWIDGDWIEEAKLVASDGEPGDVFGCSVSISNDVVVVGANGDDDNGDYSGSAYVFRWNGANWIEETKLLASDGGEDDEFGFSVDVSDNVAVIGAYGDRDNGDYAGTAYIFRWNGTQWIEEAKLLPPAHDQYYFGYSVAISGDVALVGAHFAKNNGDFTGAAYVFRDIGARWIEEAQLVASDGEKGDWFGYSVAIDEALAVIGSPNADGTVVSSGAAYVFRYEQDKWNEEAKLLASDGNLGDNFGDSVSVSRDRILIGAEKGDGLDEWSGAAYLFVNSGGQWNEEARLVASDGEMFDGFGSTVSLFQNLAVIGAPNNDENGQSSGVAYIYDDNDPVIRTECLLLDVVNLVAGEDAIVSIRQGQPNHACVAIWALRPGSLNVHIGDWCVDFGLHVPAGKGAEHVLFVQRFDADGEVARNVPIPHKVRGIDVRFQAAMKSTCPETCMSNIVTEIVQ